MLSSEKLSAYLSTAGAVEKALVAGGKMIPDLITAAETVFPAKGNGVAKLELAKTWFNAAMDKLGHDIPTIEAAWARLEPTVAVLVTIFTKNGVFASLLALTVPKAAA